MDSAYFDTVRLLLAVAPDVFRAGVFVMKGGTALNLFVHDMPRLSVDIDLAYPRWDVTREAAMSAIADELTSIAGHLRQVGLAVRSVGAAGSGESKLIIAGARAQVKVEVNLVFRGTVRPIEHRSIAPSAARLFSAELSVPSLALDELYGSKLVAALDRQHPRDLFDVARMYETRGLTEGAIECFVLYLAGHNRPIHEVLVPRHKDLAREFVTSFAGMTRDPIELANLEAARTQLVADLPRRLTSHQRSFLVGLASAEPDWALVDCPHAEALPAIRWRIRNLEQFRVSRPDEYERQLRCLRDALQV